MTHDDQGELDRLVDTQDWHGVVAVLDARWSELIAAEPQSLRRAITALPPEVLAQNARWAHAIEYVNRFVENDGPRSTRFRGTPSAPAPSSLLDVLAQLTSRAAAARANGRFAEAASAVREARSAVDEASEAAREQLAQALPELEFQWAMVWEYTGDFDAAVREYSESYDHAVVIDHVMMQARTAGSLAWLHALAGRNVQARGWLALLPDSEGEWWRSRGSITAVFAQTLLLIDELRFDEARQTLASADLAGVTERWPAQKLLASMLHRDAETSLDLLTQIDSSATSQPDALRTEGATAAFVAVARSLLFTNLGNRAGAQAALDELGVPESTLPAQIALVISASAAAEAGDHASAAKRIAGLTSTSTAEPRVLGSALALTAAAQLHDAEAAPGQAATTFALALDLARTHGLYDPLLVLTRPDLEALLALAPAASPSPVPSSSPSSSSSPSPSPSPAPSPAPAIPDPLAARLLAAARDASPDPFTALTPRERAVLGAVLAGHSTAEIAETLFVSPNTVKTQLRSIYRKTGVRNRRDLSRAALSLGHHA